MRGSVQLAGACDPLGAFLLQEKEASESAGTCGQETLSEEDPRELAGWVGRWDPWRGCALPFFPQEAS